MRSRSPDRAHALTWLLESRRSPAAVRGAHRPRFPPRYLATDTDAWANDIGARPLAASREPRSGAGDHAIAGAYRRLDADTLRAIGPPPARRPRIFVCGPTAFVGRAAHLPGRLTKGDVAI